MRVRLKFEPRDLWIGVYWNRDYHTRGPGPQGITVTTDVYVCIVPALPVHVRHVEER